MMYSPSGNWIVAAQRQPHRRVILLFERNGLLRGDFALHDPNAMVCIKLTFMLIYFV
jgi:hypothetical protein